jgi:hypothetical protein
LGTRPRLARPRDPSWPGKLDRVLQLTRLSRRKPGPAGPGSGARTPARCGRNSQTWNVFFRSGHDGELHEPGTSLLKFTSSARPIAKTAVQHGQASTNARRICRRSPVTFRLRVRIIGRCPPSLQFR